MDSNFAEAWAKKAALEGHDEAWEALYRQHYRCVLAFLRSRLPVGRGTLDEVLQDTWMVAVRRLREFEPERGSFRAWVLGIAWNVLRNRLRVVDAPEAPLPSELSAPVRSEGGDEVVRRVLSQMEPESRDLLRDRYEEGRSVAEIARRRDRTEKAIESALARARTTFRSHYQRLLAAESRT